MKINRRHIWPAVICLVLGMTTGCKTHSEEKKAAPVLSIVSTQPIDGASDVQVNSDIVVTFSEPVLMNGKTEGRISLDDGRYMEITIAGETVRGTPSVHWPYSHTVPISVYKELFRSKKNGIRLTEDYTLSFTTQSPPANARPEIISATPLYDAVDVPVDTSLVLTFSAPLQTDRLTSGMIELGNNITLAIMFSEGDTVATLIPSANLPYGALVSMAIPAGAVVNKAGIAMAEDYTIRFTTENDPTAVPPEIVRVSPLNGATDVSVDGACTFTFDQPIDTNGFTQPTISLGNGIEADVMFNASHTSVTFMPLSSLPYHTTIQFTIPRGLVVSEKGVQMAEDYVYGFTTEQDHTAVPPQIIATSPPNGATNVPVERSVTITFSEPIDTSGLTTTTFDVGVNMQVHVTFNDTDTAVTLTPSANLPYKTTISYTIPASAVVSKKGAAMAADFTLTFTTEPPPWIEMEGIVKDLVAIDAAGYVYALNRDKTISLISTDQKEIDMTVDFPSWLRNFAGIPVSMVFNSSMHRLYVLCRYSGMIASYDTETDTFIQAETIYYTFFANGIDMAVDTDRARLYVVYSETDLFLNVYHYLAIIDLETGQVEETTNLGNVVTCLALDTSSQSLYILGDTSTEAFITKFSVANDVISEIKTIYFSGHTGNMALNDDGTTLSVAAGNDITAYNQHLATMGAWHVGDPVTVLQYSPDGDRLYAATGADRLLALDAENNSAAPLSSRSFPNASRTAILAPEITGQVVTGFSYDEDKESDYKLYFFEEE